MDKLSPDAAVTQAEVPGLRLQCGKGRAGLLKPRFQHSGGLNGGLVDFQAEVDEVLYLLQGLPIAADGSRAVDKHDLGFGCVNGQAVGRTEVLERG